jgi:hypothetical protein
MPLGSEDAAGKRHKRGLIRTPSDTHAGRHATLNIWSQDLARYVRRIRSLPSLVELNQRENLGGWRNEDG